MLSNILRVLLSRALFHGTMKQRERLEKEVREKRETERIEAIKEQRKCRERFCVRPIMAETYEINMMQLYIVIRIFTIIMTIVCVFGLIMYRDGVLDGNDCVGITAPVFLWLLTYLIRFGQKYMEETKYIFYQNRISIRRLWKKEKVVTYEELSEYISKKKIRVHNGRFEFSYRGGRIPVYTWGDAPTSPKFYQFINEQCGTDIPNITKEDNEIVRKTGSGWILYSFFSLPLLAFGMFAVILSMVGDYGINHSAIEMLNYFLNYFFSITNFFSVMGLICALVGFALKLRSYFCAKRHFAHCKDIIKVSLF